MEKAVEGDLSRFEIPDLLTFFHVSRRSGVLVLERRTQETKLFLREGKPIFATSSKEELRFGNMLVRRGKVSPRDLDRVLRRTRSGGGRIGQVLLAEKALTEEELASFLKVQVSEVIFDTFVWKEGRFSFYDKVPPPGTAVTLEMDLQSLIMEGVRRLDVRGRLSEAFPDLDMVVEAVANPERVKHNVALTKEEWQVFFLVDGRRSLSEICRLAGDPDELVTLEIVHNLLAANFVTVVPPRAAPEAAAPALAAASDQGHGTQKMLDARAPALSPAVAPVSVEFSAGLPARSAEDDTKEVVRPQAIPYMGASGKLTLSRVILLKDGTETSFPLTRDAYTLGRHKNNDIVVSDPKVSSFHARMDRTPEGFVIVDLKSRNGAFVNGKRVESALLKTGDEIRLGTAKLLYKVDYTSSV